MKKMRGRYAGRRGCGDEVGGAEVQTRPVRAVGSRQRRARYHVVCSTRKGVVSLETGDGCGQWDARGVVEEESRGGGERGQRGSSPPAPENCIRRQAAFGVLPSSLLALSSTTSPSSFAPICNAAENHGSMCSENACAGRECYPLHACEDRSLGSFGPRGRRVPSHSVLRAIRQGHHAPDGRRRYRLGRTVIPLTGHHTVLCSSLTHTVIVVRTATMASRRGRQAPTTISSHLTSPRQFRGRCP